MKVKAVAMFVFFFVLLFVLFLFFGFLVFWCI